jgi:hypothetical protein
MLKKLFAALVASAFAMGAYAQAPKSDTSKAATTTTQPAAAPSTATKGDVKVDTQAAKADAKGEVKVDGDKKAKKAKAKTAKAKTAKAKSDDAKDATKKDSK